MKEHNDIDQLFEEQLGNLSAEPSARAWENISAGLDAAAGAGSSKKSRRIFLWITAGAIAALLAWLFLFIKSDAQPEKLHPNTIVETEKSIDNTNEDKLKESENLPELEKKNLPSEPKAKTAQKTTHTKSLTTTAPKQPEKTNTTQSPLPEKAVSDKPSETAIVNTTTSPKKAEKAATQKALPTAIAVNSAKTKSGKARPKSPEQAPATNNTTSANELKSGAESKAMTENPIVEESSLAKTETATNEANKENPAEAEESEVSEERATELVQEQNKPEAENIPSPDATAGIYHATGWSFDLVAGPAWISSNEKSEHLVEGPNLNPGKPVNIATPNLAFNLKFHFDNWFFQSGVGYSQYGENREYTQKLEMHDTSGYSKQQISEYYSYDSVGYYIDPTNPNVIVILYDAILHVDTSYKWITEDSLYYEHIAIQAQNRYHYIEIPAMIGYEFHFKNLGLQLSTGVSLGFRVNSSGKFLDSDNKLIDINNDNSPYSRQVLNYIFSIGLNYHLNRRLSVTLQPVYKTNINSLFTEGSGARYNHYSVNMGINYIIK